MNLFIFAIIINIVLASPPPSYSNLNTNSKSNDDTDTPILYEDNDLTNLLNNVIQQTIYEYYDNQTNTNTKTRRGAYDVSSSITCTTTPSYNANNQMILSTVCQNTGSISPPSKSCFSADTFVYVEINDTYTTVRMDELKNYIGYNILSYSDKYNIVGSKLISFSHIDETVTVQFLDIYTKNAMISITENHLIYKVVNDEMVRVFADDLMIDDYIIIYNNNTQWLMYEKIQKIDIVYKTGIYAPMTYDALPFVVSNVLSSPFSTFNNKFMDIMYYYYSTFIA